MMEIVFSKVAGINVNTRQVAVAVHVPDDRSGATNHVRRK